MLKTLIVGYGRAGEGLHLPCLRKARLRPGGAGLFADTVGVVDPVRASTSCHDAAGLARFENLAQVRGFDPAETVVHICTPPDSHLTALRQVTDRGYTRILVEKPLVPSERELDEVLALQEYGCDILVVANWLHSTLTARLRGLLQSGRFGGLRHLRFAQHKPRFSRTLDSRGNDSAFDVELPHQVALALHLAGEWAEVLSARSTDLCVNGTTVPHMGSARITLLHSAGLASTLTSRLDAFCRLRRIELEFDDHRVIGHYPIEGGECFAGLKVRGPDGRVLRSEVFADDPLTECFVACYRSFHGTGEKPISDVRFNAAIVSTICRAKDLCGVDGRMIRSVARSRTRMRGDDCS